MIKFKCKCGAETLRTTLTVTKEYGYSGNVLARYEDFNVYDKKETIVYKAKCLMCNKEFGTALTFSDLEELLMHEGVLK